MTEATWGGSTPQASIEWSMSAALENVPRGDSDLAEVTSLEGAVRAWRDLDREHRIQARLTTERPIHLDGVPTAIFTGDAINELVKRLPA
jgi:hypothetical protein